MAEPSGTPEFYYLGADSKPAGPLALAALKDMVAGGRLTEESMVWREGMPQWTALKEVEGTLVQDPAARGDASAAQKPTPTLSSAPKAADPEDVLASFMGEISAVEAEVEAQKTGSAGEGRAATPPADEQEFTDDDGTVYKWDGELRRFMPVSGDTAIYSEADMVFAAEAEAIPTMAEAKAKEKENEERPLTEEEKRKRQREEAMEAQKEKIAKVQEAKKENNKEGWFDLKKNTSVYLTGLPHDATVEEVKERFSACGIIKENDDRTPRIKLYVDKATGMMKGDGLVTFLMEPSVEIACTIMDGAPLRATEQGPAMSVTRAKFEMKKDHVKKDKTKPKHKKKKQVQSQEKKLNWDGFDDVKKPEDVTVILKHMFNVAEMETNPALRGELEEDVAAECSKLGAIARLRVFAGNPEGVVSIRFKLEDPARECIKLMNGRFFGGRQIVAHMYDGVTNYNVTAPGADEREAARLEAYRRELEARGEPK